MNGILIATKKYELTFFQQSTMLLLSAIDRVWPKTDELSEWNK